jgi:GDP-D-mannose dehydratase
LQDFSIARSFSTFRACATTLLVTSKTIEQQMIRPSEVDLLVGDARKAREILGWTPKVDFKDLVKLMVDRDLSLEKS